MRTKATTSLLAGVFLLPLPLYAQTLSPCMEELVRNGADSLTLGEIRARCPASTGKAVGTSPRITEEKSLETRPSSPLSPMDRRMDTEQSNMLKPFTLMAHKPNYILPAAYNFAGWGSATCSDIDGEQQLDLDRTEVQFQLSVKMPLGTDLPGTGTSLWGAYTVRSFWQAYNASESSPFRETNHEPEMWLQHRSNLQLGPLKNVGNSLGVVHQSNGQGGSLSRSWNRAYAAFGFELGDLTFMIKPWYRFKESLDDDDNPDITDFLGHGELTASWRYDENIFSLISRNNLESGFSKGSLELGWSFPLGSYPWLKGYIQYFTGYGESLIDYDHYVNKLGIGVSLTDWL